MEDASRKTELECMADMLVLLRSIKEHLSFGVSKHLDSKWFEWYNQLTAKLRTAANCKRFASNFEGLARDLDELFTPKQISTGETSRRISEHELKDANSLLNALEEKTQKRMKRIRRKVGARSTEPQQPEPNLEMGRPSWTRNLGLAAYYPVSWAFLATHLELGSIVWALSLAGAAMSLLYVVDTWVIYEAKPIWIYDKSKVGPFTAKLARDGHLLLWILLSLIPFCIQSYILLQTLWSILLIIEVTNLAIIVSIATSVYTWVLYRYVQWRRGPLLACPWCGKEHKNPEPMKQHCKAVHLITPKEYMLKREESQEEKETNWVVRGLVIVGTWDLGIEILLYIKYNDIFKFIGLLALDLVLIVGSGLVKNWIELNERETKKRGGPTELQEQVEERAMHVLKYRSVFTIVYMVFLLATFQDGVTLIVLLSAPAFAFIAMIGAHSEVKGPETNLTTFWRECASIKQSFPFAILGAALNILVGVPIWLLSESIFWTIFLGIAPARAAEFFWKLHLKYNARDFRLRDS